MKRISLHIGFWLCFITLTAIVEFLWDRASLPHLGQSELVIIAIKAGFLFTISKFLFANYVTYFAIERIVKRKQPLIFGIAKIALALFVCIIIDRLIANYLIVPYAYHNIIHTSPIFTPTAVVIVILFAVFVTGLMLAIKSVREQLQAKEREKNLIKEKLETELKFLRNQTNPHFLLNTLYNIYALARKGSEETAEVVMRLAELLQFMLYQSNENLIPLKDEIKVLEDYMELEMIRYNNRLNVSFNKEVDAAPYQITPLLLLPYLENAFKYGVSETRFESIINVAIKVKDGLLNFEIENSYDSSIPDKERNTIGLTNARRQLELTYNEHNLEINNANHIFKVNLFINLNTYVEI